MSQKRYRVLRVLEYEGSLEFIQATINNRTVKESITFASHGCEDCVIREGFIGDVVDLIHDETPKILEKVNYCLGPRADKLFANFESEEEAIKFVALKENEWILQFHPLYLWKIIPNSTPIIIGVYDPESNSWIKKP